MKCIIFCLLLAVALAEPEHHDDQLDQNQRRRMQSLSLTLLDDHDADQQVHDHSYDKEGRSPSQSYHQSHASYNHDDVVPSEDIRSHSHHSHDRSDSVDSKVKSIKHDDEHSTLRLLTPEDENNNLNELATNLDRLTSKYQGRGVLKVSYNPSDTKQVDSRTFKLGSLRFTYVAPPKESGSQQGYNGYNDKYDSSNRVYSGDNQGYNGYNDKHNSYSSGYNYNPYPYANSKVDLHPSYSSYKSPSSSQYIYLPRNYNYNEHSSYGAYLRDSQDSRQEQDDDRQDDEIEHDDTSERK